jgi:hypothetical protein
MVLNTFPENFSNFYLFKTADDKINIENELNKKDAMLKICPNHSATRA